MATWLPGHPLLIGVDTGGTFTDFIALEHGRVRRLKLPSTPADPGRAVAEGIALLDPAGVATVVHGTTVATNALLQGRLGRVTFVTNSGFEDVIEIGRQARPELYALEVVKPDPLVPRDRRIGVRQRTAHDGRDTVPLSDSALRTLRRTVARSKPEAIAIGLLHSFLDPAPEQRIAAALKDLGVPIDCSAAIAPSIREYERFSTVIANAALLPHVGRYVDRLAATLAPRPLFVFLSNGGRSCAAAAARLPVRLVLSGPAGGAVAADRIVRRAGLDAAIALDMGGTSTDVALIRGAPERRGEIDFAGHPLLVPSLDIESVGSGGGSVAHIDAGGMLRVGPQSAGADPGPACYGKGDLPTVTDAHVVLGRLPLHLSGGVTLDPERSRRAIGRLGKALGRDAIATAFAVLAIADATMARAARLVAVNRGADPRDLELLAFGGAGGLHASRLARLLPCRGAIVPPTPGHLSALGMLLADPEVDVARTVLVRDPDRRRTRIDRELARLEREARARLRDDAGVTDSRTAVKRKVAADRRDRVIVERLLECRYVGQTATLAVPAGRNVRRAFESAHRARYDHVFPEREIEVVDVVVRARAPRRIELPDPFADDVRRSLSRAATGTTRANFEGSRRTVAMPCFDRSLLPRGARIRGPARIDDAGATIVVEPWANATVDAHGNLRLRDRSARS